MFRVLVSDKMSSEGLQPLLDHPEIEVIEKNVNEVEEELHTFDVLFVRSATKVTEELLVKMSNVKLIARAGVGVDNIDLPAATKHGVIVVNAPDGNTISTAEHTFAMMMSLVRKIPQAHISVMSREWNRSAFSGTELHSKTLGIVGMGKIGTELATRAKAFRMNVIVFDPFLTKSRAEKIGVTSVSLEEILQTADIITVHTPLTNETRGLINKHNIYTTKKGVYLINCARGGIIDEDALYEAIESGHVGGCALDVYTQEPLLDERFLSLPQVVLTPHIAASTKEAQVNVAVHVSNEVVRFYNGEPVSSSINLPTIPASAFEFAKPFYELSKKLGSLLSQAVKKPVQEIKISYYGEAEVENSFTSRALLTEFLRNRIATTVNEVNVTMICKERGLSYGTTVTTNSFGYSNGISVTASGEDFEYTIKGTYIKEYGIRIVSIAGFEIDFDPTGYVVLVRHNDIPGVIGRVGRIFGDNDINIATMQVGRKQIGGEAIMLLTVDKELDEVVIKELISLNEIHKLQAIHL